MPAYKLEGLRHLLRAQPPKLHGRDWAGKWVNSFFKLTLTERSVEPAQFEVAHCASRVNHDSVADKDGLHQSQSARKPVDIADAVAGGWRLGIRHPNGGVIQLSCAIHGSEPCVHLARINKLKRRHFNSQTGAKTRTIEKPICYRLKLRSQRAPTAVCSACRRGDKRSSSVQRKPQ